MAARTGAAIDCCSLRTEREACEGVVLFWSLADLLQAVCLACLPPNVCAVSEWLYGGFVCCSV